ncbi:MAG TPA: tetratricopeptide repeat protein, partial [Herpetosiphonaceae bacterium]|nr:tetratricopeptide repeat protein [Herpetosiphonaceae bacterium]
VPPLALPDTNAPLAADALVEYDAVALVLNRLREHAPEFVVSAGNAAQLAELCRVLDGLPLALELAAARLRDYALDQLLGLLDRRYAVLVNPDSSSPRQQSMRAVIDWSYRLLSAEEQWIVRRLAVFAGGWSLASGRAMLAPQEISDDDMLLAMGGLIEKSFVVLDSHSGSVRYRMSQTVRAYVRECLLDQGEAARLREQYAGYYLELARAANRGFASADQSMWLNQIDTEQANIQEVLRWAFESGTIEPGLAIGGALWRFWYLRGDAENYRWLQRLVDRAAALPPTIAYLQGLNGIGNIAQQHSDYGRAIAFHSRALELARQLDARPNAAAALNNLARAFWMQGKYGQAIGYLQESIALNDSLGASFPKAVNLGNLGTMYRDCGEYEPALAAYTASLAIHRAANNTWGIAMSLYRIGVLHHVQGQVVQAATFYQQSLNLRSSIRDNDGLVYSLYSLGLLALHKNEYAQARSLLDESLAISRCHGGRLERSLILIAQARLLGRRHEPKKAWLFLQESIELQVGLGCPLLVATLLEAMAEVAQRGTWTQECRSLAQSIRAQIGTPLPPIEQAPAWEAGVSQSERFHADVVCLGQPASAHECQAKVLDRIVAAILSDLPAQPDRSS